MCQNLEKVFLGKLAGMPAEECDISPAAPKPKRIMKQTVTPPVAIPVSTITQAPPPTVAKLPTPKTLPTPPPVSTGTNSVSNKQSTVQTAKTTAPSTVVPAPLPAVAPTSPGPLDVVKSPPAGVFNQTLPVKV